MYKFILIFLLSAVTLLGKAQSTVGNTGLLNIPSANMQKDGTFVVGGNYLPEEFTPANFSYPTGNYFLNLTFLPFLEVTYRCTFFKTMKTGRYTQQDRTFAVRLQLLKEKKYLPAIVVGGNDIYSEYMSEGKNQYLGSLFAVGTKTLRVNDHDFAFTLGYGFKYYNANQLQGLFGGISYTPSFMRSVRIMADYDTKSVNVGASVLFFKHLSVNAFLNDGKWFVGGVAYKLYLKKSLAKARRRKEKKNAKSFLDS